MNMQLFNPETLLLDDINIETLKAALKKRTLFFLKFFGLLIVIIPIFPFLPSRYGHNHWPKDLNDYKSQIAFIYLFFCLPFALYTYYMTVYRIKRDLMHGTKVRFNAMVEKTKPDNKISKRDKFCDIIVTPIKENESRKELSYYLKKNTFPSNRLTIQLPVEVYRSLKEPEIIIEISTYSKTFLYLKEV